MLMLFQIFLQKKEKNENMDLVIGVEGWSMIIFTVVVHAIVNLWEHLHPGAWGGGGIHNPCFGLRDGP